MEVPSISILLPFYQAEEVLPGAVDSILRQTCQDWELLLIDNNSSDNGVEVAMAYGRKDKRIKVLHEPRQGIAYALNTGLKHAKAPIIARMDADDFSLPERLEKQYAFLVQNPSVDVVSCCCDFHSELSESNGYQCYVQWQNSILFPYDHARNFFAESPLAHPSVMFRMALVERYGVYATEAVPEDYELWLRWHVNGVRFEKLQETLLVWNDHRSRLSRNHDNYTDEAFDLVRIKYLSAWLKKHINPERKVVVCGTGKRPRARAGLLLKAGVPIYAFTDLKQKSQCGAIFLPPSDITVKDNYFIISFISKRGVGESIRKFLTGKGLSELDDFVIAG
ncbi:glycosyltransferase [Cytophagaceae bacterium ABcell3]|nr:glycosyltransferase [Cytophagaceae bacterium ABcell3]